MGQDQENSCVSLEYLKKKRSDVENALHILDVITHSTDIDQSLSLGSVFF